MIKDYAFKERYGFDDLVEIVSLLRSPGGCPWDKEQTHKSIRANFIEETYEAVEAIDTDNPELLREELGDVLLQVALHAEIEREKGAFTIYDVADEICKKLIVRHPHVFGDIRADTTGEVLKNWDEIKKQTKGQKSQTEVMESVSRALPALMRSTKIQQKAARSGFDWHDVSGALAKVREELSELEAEIARGDKKACADELGDLLFAAVNVARFVDAEPEGALAAACDKFIRRFALCEQFADESGHPLQSMNEQALDALWKRAKEVLQSDAEQPQTDFNRNPKMEGM
jgi:tetrapyrrole methylase family protein / MazG family protein